MAISLLPIVFGVTALALMPSPDALMHPYDQALGNLTANCVKYDVKERRRQRTEYVHGDQHFRVDGSISTRDSQLITIVTPEAVRYHDSKQRAVIIGVPYEPNNQSIRRLLAGLVAQRGRVHYSGEEIYKEQLAHRFELRTDSNTQLPSGANYVGPVGSYMRTTIWVAKTDHMPLGIQIAHVTPDEQGRSDYDIVSERLLYHSFEFQEDNTAIFNPKTPDGWKVYDLRREDAQGLGDYRLVKLPEFASNTELHIIGAYTGALPGHLRTPFRSHLESTINVRITRTAAPVVIALCAYDRVLWDLELSEGVELAGIIVSGYHEHRLAGIDLSKSDVPVLYMSHKRGDKQKLYQVRKQEDDTTNRQQVALKKLSDLTGLPVKRVQTSYDTPTYVVE